MDKKEKKSIYNKRYLEKQKAKQEQKPEKEQEKEDNFFLKNSMPAKPVPIYQYQQTQTLKQKMIETLAISSISLIPIIAKIIYSRLSNKSEPVEQPTSINLHQLPNF